MDVGQDFDSRGELRCRPVESGLIAISLLFSQSGSGCSAAVGTRSLSARNGFFGIANNAPGLFVDGPVVVVIVYLARPIG